jgi:hypothetical protein
MADAQKTMPLACVVVRPPEDGGSREEYNTVVEEIKALAQGAQK